MHRVPSAIARRGETATINRASPAASPSLATSVHRLVGLPVLADLGSPDNYLLVTLVALVAGLVSGGLLVAVLVIRSRWIVPVRSLARTAERMSQGRWETRTEPASGAGEVKALGEQLNKMAAQAQTQLQTLQHQSGNLQLLVDALPDPILLADSDGRIVLINAPAARLLQVPATQIVGKRFLCAVNDAAILDLYESVIDSPAGTPPAIIHREIKLIRNIQRLSFQALGERTTGGGVLIVLRDVSTLAATIQMKTDFVANASHELRTPISAIKVAFETLRDVYSDDHNLTQRCIAIIDGHLRRLEEMLRDLLDLSRVETADLKPHLAPVRAIDLLAVIRSTWAPIAGEKQVDLQLPADQAADLVFTSDRRLLDLVLKNLVENAIKFTPPRGKVTLSICDRPPLTSESPHPGEIVMSVADSGIGVSAEHLERVFERFYQVDAARSGSSGRGTGLGLAIVKHAVHALGGSVKLASHVGRGTTVTCIFPRLDVPGADGAAPALRALPAALQKVS